MTRFALNVERVKRKTPVLETLTPAEQLMDLLRDRLPPEACSFSAARDAPGVVICHQGRALGIQFRDDKLSPAQLDCFRRLRDAGMRIEIARTVNEALTLIAEMGVILKPVINSIHAARDFFREETRRSN